MAVLGPTSCSLLFAGAYWLELLGRRGGLPAAFARRPVHLGPLQLHSLDCLLAAAAAALAPIAAALAWRRAQRPFVPA